MMKVVVALCVIFAVSQAAHTTNWYSGSVNATGTPQAKAVDTAVTTGCQLVAGAATGYRNFTVNVTTAGFFYFTALFEKVFKTNAQLQVYNGPYDPVNACTNLIYARTAQSDVPHVEFLQYLTPGLYPVVVTGPTATNLGLFAIHVDAATLNGATNELTSKYWNSPQSGTGADRFTCDPSSTLGTYVQLNFPTQNGTDIVDVLVFGYNSTVLTSWEFGAAIYNSTNLPFVGTGNMTNPANPCSTQNYTYGITTFYSDLGFNLQNTESYQATAALGVTFTNGITYSVVVGTYDTDVLTANFGVFMRPTATGNLGTTLNYVAPDVPAVSTTNECVPNVQKYYGINWFTAIYNAYILDNPTDFFDTSGCLYRGLNIGNATAPPATCPGNVSHLAFIQCGDTGDGGPVANFLIPGVNYTWIQISYGSGTGTAGAKYLVYNYSGKLLGAAPVTTTGVATTAAMEMSSSSASSVVVMLALYIAAMFF